MVSFAQRGWLFLKNYGTATRIYCLACLCMFIIVPNVYFKRNGSPMCTIVSFRSNHLHPGRRDFWKSCRMQRCPKVSFVNFFIACVYYFSPSLQTNVTLLLDGDTLFPRAIWCLSFCIAFSFIHRITIVLNLCLCMAG